MFSGCSNSFILPDKLRGTRETRGGGAAPPAKRDIEHSLRVRPHYSDGLQHRHVRAGRHLQNGWPHDPK